MEGQERVALVTGGSRGIGRAIGLELAKRGATVVVNYVQREDAAEAVVSEIESLGGDALAVQADVGDYAQAAQLVQKTVESLGRLDILVNNAGITRDALLVRMNESEWDDVLRINLKGAYNVTKAAVRPMMRRRWGRIINISSVSGLRGQLGQSNYAASKAGLIGLTKSLARELGRRGITVNAVAPGLIPTEMTAALGAEFLSQLRKAIPLGRFGTTEDVAQAVAFLASEAAAYITGIVLPVDGGLSM